MDDSVATAVPSPPRRQLLYLLIAAISLAAYLALWLGSRSPWGRYLDHAVAFNSSAAQLTSTLFVLGWTLMVMAMMLPTAVPLVDAFARVVGRRPERRRLLALLTAGFVGVWAAFGYVLLWVDLVVHAATDRVELVGDRPALVFAAVLIAAGLYQFSALKRQCLTRCRSPLSLIVPRWTGRRAPADAARIGIAYGLSCLGCCWTLMLVVFAVGTANLGVMFVFGLLMAVEKNVPRARRLTPALGAVLVGAGLALALATVA